MPGVPTPVHRELSKGVEKVSPPPVTVGSRMAFVARFLGRRLAYTYEVREIVRRELSDALESGVTEWTQMKTGVKDALSKYLYSKTKRKPMILPVIMNV